MAKKQKIMGLTNGELASIRTTAVEIAARLPEDRVIGASMMSGTGYKEPGKSADKLLADAAKIVAFITAK